MPFAGFFGRLAFAREAAAWRREGRTLRLWWRDDDACALTPDLNGLLSLSAAHGAPLALAVVPLGAGERLPDDFVEAVNAAPLVSVMQHGVDHVSRRAEGSTPAQFHDADPPAKIAADIAQAGAVLAPFTRRLPVYVPPWNAVQAALPAALAMQKMSLSANGAPCGPRRLDVHVDLLRWGGEAPRFRGAGRIWRRLARLMRERRSAGDYGQPIGFLTHHLDHDPAAWEFLHAMFEIVERSRAVRWVDAGEMLATAAHPGEGPGPDDKAPSPTALS